MIRLAVMYSGGMWKWAPEYKKVVSEASPSGTYPMCEVRTGGITKESDAVLFGTRTIEILIRTALRVNSLDAVAVMILTGLGVCLLLQE